MRAYLVTDIRKRKSLIADLATAAAVAELEPHELEYALDEEGVCDTDQYTITDMRHGRPQPWRHELSIPYPIIAPSRA